MQPAAAPHNGSGAGRSRAADGEDQLATAQLLADAADAAAAAGYARGDGELPLPGRPGCVVHDRLPCDLQQVLGATAAAASQPWLAFSCSRGDTGLLIKQDNSSGHAYCQADGSMAGGLSVQYSFNSNSTIKPKPAGTTAHGEILSLIKAPGQVRVTLKAVQGSGVLLRVYRISVLRQNGPAGAATAAESAAAAAAAMEAAGKDEASPQQQQGKKRKRGSKQQQQQQQPAYWQASDKGLLGCVCLYVFTGELVASNSADQAEAAEKLQQLRGLRPLPQIEADGGGCEATMLADAIPAAAEPSESAGAAAGAWAAGLSDCAECGHPFLDCCCLLDEEVQQLLGTMAAFPEPQQQQQSATSGAAGSAAGSLRQLLAGCCTPPRPAATGGWGGQQRPAEGAGADWLAAGGAAAAVAATGPGFAAAQDQPGLRYQHQQQQQLADAATHGASRRMPLVQQARLMSAVNSLSARAARLRYDLLALAAGTHGEGSVAALHGLLQRVQEHNAAAAAVVAPGGCAADTRVCLLQVREDWFLKRTLLHLLCSRVRVFGPQAAVDGPELTGLSGPVRQQLLQQLWQIATSDDSSSGSSGSRADGSSTQPHTGNGSGAAAEQLLWARNVNKATPWLTACHFCIPEVLDWMLGLPEVTFDVMTAQTKNGRMFYHVLCRQAAEQQRQQQQPGGDHNAQPACSSDHKQGLAKALAALADRLGTWLQDMAANSPDELQQLRQDVIEASGAPEQVMQQQAWQQPAAISPGGGGGGSGSRWSAEVLWWLQAEVLFHTHTPHKYDRRMLDETALELFGFTVRQQPPAVVQDG